MATKELRTNFIFFSPLFVVVGYGISEGSRFWDEKKLGYGIKDKHFGSATLGLNAEKI